MNEILEAANNHDSQWLDSAPYPIAMLNSPGQALVELFVTHSFSKIAVLADTNTEKLCYSKIKSFLPPHELLVVAPGEGSKTFQQCNEIWKQLTRWNFDRKSLLINLGGGMICDLGGFAASVYKRGIPFIHLPTTLLAQVDASIGGKTGVNLEGYKNQVGTFTEPFAVLIWPGFLQSEPPEQKISGFAEMLKHALISSKDTFERLIEYGPAIAEEPQMLAESMKVKLRIVEADPHEQNERKLLNLGHTLGHAIESWSLLNHTRPVLHGEAVAAGLWCEGFISYQKKNMQEGDWVHLSKFIEKWFPKISISENEIPAIAGFILQDKKNESGKVLCTLPFSPGIAKVNQELTLQEAKDSLLAYSRIPSGGSLSK